MIVDCGCHFLQFFTIDLADWTIYTTAMMPIRRPGPPSDHKISLFISSGHQDHSPSSCHWTGGVSLFQPPILVEYAYRSSSEPASWGSNLPSAMSLVRPATSSLLWYIRFMPRGSARHDVRFSDSRVGQQFNSFVRAFRLTPVPFRFSFLKV